MRILYPRRGAILDGAVLPSAGAGKPVAKSAGKSSGRRVVKASRLHWPLFTNRVL